MSLATGTRLGAFEILAALGAGGMGEVYRARDTRLDRDVALKVMGTRIAGTPELRERFDREARAISQLNHPNICTLYDVGHQAGTSYLVLEYLEGETLAARIQRGAVPPGEALPIAIAICEALDKAHRQGIVHRDLKPGNVMLVKPGASKPTTVQASRPASQVKLLDFGLAKIAAASIAQEPGGAPPAGSALHPSMPVTQSTPLTLQGTILGTFQYMAPEMLEGAEADARADIWAFGCVLYEMLTGKPAFEGRTQASLISAILATEPAPMATLQPLAPPALEHTVKTCLAKDPDERFQNAHDVLLQLKWMASAGSQAGVPAPVAARRRLHSHGRLAAAVAAAILLTAIAVWSLVRPAARPPAPMIRAAVSLPAGVEYNPFGSANLAVAPDGSAMVYSVIDGESNYLLMRPTGGTESSVIPGTGAAFLPFFSPDGAWIGFWESGKLRKMPRGGGAAITICQMDAPLGATWLPDNTIVFAGQPEGGLMRVSADGGPVEAFTTPAEGESSHRWPSALPDGRGVLYAALGGGSWSDARIMLQPTAGGASTLLVTGGSAPRYVASGHLLYVRARTVFAVPFDLRSQMAGAGARPVIEDVMMNDGDGRSSFAVSQTGLAAYVRATTEHDRRSLVWVRADGRAETLPVGDRAFEHPRISPDGRSVALTIREEDPDIWVLNLARGTLTRLTFERGEDESPVWTPDSARVTFASSRGPKRETRWRAADGSTPEEVLFETPRHHHLAGWTPDGQTLITEESSGSGWDFWTNGLADRTSTALIQNGFFHAGAAISPNGRWLAYSSNEGGPLQVYVQAYPGPGGRFQVSNDGGAEPRWARDGRTLYYRQAQRMMAVPVETEGLFSAGPSRTLFEGDYTRIGWNQANYDVAPDGKSFLMIKGSVQGGPREIGIIGNWLDELTALVPVRK
jgi:eukaryotic-like serine/threonine-protein kinase